MIEYAQVFRTGLNNSEIGYNIKVSLHPMHATCMCTPLAMKIAIHQNTR